MKKHLLRFLLIVMIVCFGVGIMAACGDDTEGENPNPDEATTYTLTYKANGGVGADKTEQHKEGDTVTVLGADTFTYEGYTFTKWKEEGGSAEYNAGATFTMPARNVTLAAQWQADGSSETEYEIKVNDPTGKAHVEFDKEAPYHTGDVVKFTVDFAPGDNLRVVSVKADGVELQKGEDGKYTVTVAEKDIEITIESEPMGEHEFDVSLSVTGGSNGNSATLDKEGKVAKDTKVTLTVVTAEGYTAEVKLNGNKVNLDAQGKYEHTVTADAAFTVTFTQNDEPGPGPSAKDLTIFHNAGMSADGNDIQLVLRFNATGYVNADELTADLKVAVGSVEVAPYHVDFSADGANTAYFHISVAELTIKSGSSAQVTLKSTAAAKTYDVPATSVDSAQSTAVFDGGTYTLALEGEKLVLKYTAEEPAPADEIDGVWTVETEEGTVTLYIKKVADGIDMAEITMLESDGESTEIGASVHLPMKSENTYGYETSDSSVTISVVDGKLTYTINGQTHTSTSKTALPASITLPNGVYENAEKTVTLTLGTSSTLVRNGDTQTVTPAVVGNFILLLAKHEGNAEGVMAGSFAKLEDNGSLTLYVGEEKYTLTKQAGEEPGDKALSDFGASDAITYGAEGVRIVLRFKATGYDTTTIKSDITIKINDVSIAAHEVGGNATTGYEVYFLLKPEDIAKIGSDPCKITLVAEAEITQISNGIGQNNAKFGGRVFTLSVENNELTLTVTATSTESTVTVNVNGKPETVDGLGYELKNGGDAVASGSKVSTGASLTLTVTVPEGYTATVKVDGAVLEGSNNSYTIKSLTENVTITITYAEESQPGDKALSDFGASDAITYGTEGVRIVLRFKATGYDTTTIKSDITIKINDVSIAAHEVGGNATTGYEVYFLLKPEDIAKIGSDPCKITLVAEKEITKISSGTTGQNNAKFGGKTFTLSVAENELTLTVSGGSAPDPTVKSFNITGGDIKLENDSIYFVVNGTYTLYTEAELKAELLKYKFDLQKLSGAASGNPDDWTVQTRHPLETLEANITVAAGTWSVKYDISKMDSYTYAAHFSPDATPGDLKVPAEEGKVLEFGGRNYTLHYTAGGGNQLTYWGCVGLMIKSTSDPVKYSTPSISLDGKNITIDNKGQTGIREYHVGVFNADGLQLRTYVFTKTTDTIDDTRLRDGTYQLKVKLVSASLDYIDSDWSDAAATDYTVAYGKFEYDLNYGGEQGMAYDEWIYWEQDSGNVTKGVSKYSDGVVTITFTNNNVTDAGLFYATQIFYKSTALKQGDNYSIKFKITSTAAGKITINGTPVDLEANVEKSVTLSGLTQGANSTVSIQCAVNGAELSTRIKAATFTIKEVNIEKTSEATPEKPTFTFVKGDGATGEDPSLVADEPNDMGGYTVSLPENPYTAPAGKYFRGWEINGTVYFPDEVYDAEACATITITAVWEDLYTNYDQSVTLSHTWTNPVNVIVTDGAPAIELTATVSDTAPDSWHGILVDVNMTIKGASASDFIRLRVDGFIFTFKDDTTNIANIEKDVSKWYATSYTALFADGGKAVQRVTASLSGKILTYTIATYAAGTTDFSTAQPVASVTYNVESAVDVHALKLSFYYDDGLMADEVTPNNTMSFTDAKVKASVPVSENQDPTAEKPITIGTDDNKLVHGGMPLWTTRLKKGEKVVLKGTMTSAAVNNFDAAGMYLYDGLCSNFNIRADNFVNENTSSDKWPMTTHEGWSITSSNIGSTVVAVGGDWWAGAKAILKKADVEITFDYTGENVIVTFKATGTDENAGENLGKIFTYAYTVAKGTGTFAEDFTIGLGGESSYTVINSLTRTSVKA